MFKMKNLLFCLFCYTLFISCQSTVAKKSLPPEATISGTIENATKSGVTILIDGEETNLELVDGSFEYTFELNHPKLVTFIYEGINEECFVRPGKTTSIDVKLKDPEIEESKTMISYKGDLSNENNFLSNGLIEHELPGFRDLFAQDETSFLQTLEAYQEAVDQSIATAQKEKIFDADFKALIHSQAEYEVAIQLGSYESYHGYLTDNEDFQVSELISAQIDAIKLDNPAAIASSRYQGFVQNSIQQEAWNSIKDDDTRKNAPGAMTITSLKIMDQKIESKEVREIAMYQILKYALYDGLQESEMEAYDRFVTENQNESYLAQINESIEKWQKLDSGQEAPVFAYFDIQGKQVSLTDLKGKVVYIDVWATWCAPCKAEQPDLVKLEEHYASNPAVAFVGVSIDEDKSAWETMVTKEGMKGYQLIADEAWNSGIVKDYLIRGIPRFILIDAEGKIIQASAPRPSSGKVAELIDAELAKSTQEALLVR
jgi:thiol-disulfide isomerase/thioredoxin